MFKKALNKIKLYMKIKKERDAILLRTASLKFWFMGYYSNFT